VNFTPTPDDEAKEFTTDTKPLERGVYEGVITKAIDTFTHETEKEMLEVTIKIRGRSIKDWFVGESKIGAARLRNLAEAIGKLDRYKTGELSARDITPGTPVQVVLGVKRGNKNYRARNFVEEYKRSSNSVVELRAG
jgi:hypothetical protein